MSLFCAICLWLRIVGNQEKKCFAWEYKGPKKNLVQAYAQLKQYADALENPPLLIVSDMQEIRIHTNFTNAITAQHSIKLIDMRDPAPRRMLRDCFENPDNLRPTATRESVTAEAAAALGGMAARLRAQGLEPGRVAHFLNKLVFCLFSEDINLLPNRLFAEIVEEAAKQADDFVPMLRELFTAMANGGRRFGSASVPYFNGGLFNDDDVLNLGPLGIADLSAVARLDWSAIEPFIFGTLFERGLDPATRRDMAMLFDVDAQRSPQAALFGFAATESRAGIGIHYTDPQTIAKIIDPVVLWPLAREWNQLKGMAGAMGARNVAREYLSFREKLGAFRVLDPACGSGNFLAYALSALKDFDLSVRGQAAAIGLPSDPPRVGPQNVLGIEIDPYAAELARLTVWITELQWEIRNGFPIKRSPVLGALDGIMRRDALLNPDYSRAEWPVAEVVIGNPPFVGGKLMRTKLTGERVEQLFAAYAGLVPAEADLVTYWFANAWEGIKAGRHKRAGFVATNSIRGGASRRILDRISREGAIFEAWDDERWVVDGAAVRVSLICFARETPSEGVRLDGRPVQRLNADLTESIDLTAAQRLGENRGIAFMGDTKGGAFDVPGDLARQWLQLPLNPNGRPNSDVLRPWLNGMDVTRKSSGRWIIDFGWEMSERDAALYEVPFGYVAEHVRGPRQELRREAYRRYWWRHVEPRPGMWRAVHGLNRYIVTPRVAKHRLFKWIDLKTVPDSRLFVFARDDDVFFGMLQSRFHEQWSLRTCSWHGVGNDPTYNIDSVFERFPFPEGLTPAQRVADCERQPRAAAIAAAARRLNELREAWLYPYDLIECVPEVVPGYSDRLVPKNEKAEAELKQRTLTNLYNLRPSWLDNAHGDLDAAVAEAYGWTPAISEEQVVARLLELNLSRHSAQTRDVH